MLRSTDQKYVFSARLRDLAGNQMGQSDKILWGSADRLLFDQTDPPSLDKGHYLEHTLAFHVDPTIPTGVYSMDVSIFRVPTFESVPLTRMVDTAPDSIKLDGLLIAGLPDLGPTDSVPIPHQVQADVGDSLTLDGYDIHQTGVGSGEDLQVSLYWEARKQPDQDYTVFVQLLDASGKVTAQSDGYPADGRFPTSWLRPGLVLRDIHRLSIPASVAQDSFQLIVGMYQLKSMQRLPIRTANSSAVADHVTLDPKVSLAAR
jgi:hypothetical protein